MPPLIMQVCDGDVQNVRLACVCFDSKAGDVWSQLWLCTGQVAQQPLPPHVCNNTPLVMTLPRLLLNCDLWCSHNE